MAWQQYGERRYYYRSIRHGDQVRKDYFGAGKGAQLASSIDALSQAEIKAERETARHERQIFGEAVSIMNRLNAWSDLLFAAAFLAAGFHRPRRHSWRKWRDGRAFLESARRAHSWR